MVMMSNDEVIRITKRADAFVRTIHGSLSRMSPAHLMPGIPPVDPPVPLPELEAVMNGHVNEQHDSKAADIVRIEKALKLHNVNFCNPYLNQMYQKEVQAAWWAVVFAHEEWISAFIGRKFGNSPHFDDLLSESRLALYRAAQLFDPAEGTPFRYYARWWVKKHCQRYLNKQRDLILPGEDQVDIVDESPEVAPDNNLVRASHRKEVSAEFELAMSVKMTFSQRKQRIIGFLMDGCSQADVAAEIGISKRSVQAVWKEFRELCREARARRGLPVAAG